MDQRCTRLADIGERFRAVEQLERMLNVVEVEGILRREDGLRNMNLPYEAKKPYLLPNDSLSTRFVVQECHERVIHGGVNAALTKVKRQFCISKGRQVVKKILKQCGICTNIGGACYKSVTTRKGHTIKSI